MDPRLVKLGDELSSKPSHEGRNTPHDRRVVTMVKTGQSWAPRQQPAAEAPATP
jgi:hypothetical protein